MHGDNREGGAPEEITTGNFGDEGTIQESIHMS
jgi:hypothetical protein